MKRGTSAQVSLIFRRLREILLPLYPNQGPLLHYANPFELMVAVVLSAQCTDDRVNQISPEIFKRWPNPLAMAEADLGELMEVIRPAGFFRSKAGYIRESARIILDRFGGILPFGMEELTSLPGIGRKSAHVIRSACAGLPGIIVDTHVIRVMNRVGALATEDPLQIERQISALLAEEEWTAFSHAVNRHGKYTCQARKPACPACPLASFCPWPSKAKLKKPTAVKKKADV